MCVTKTVSLEHAQTKLGANQITKEDIKQMYEPSKAERGIKASILVSWRPVGTPLENEKVPKSDVMNKRFQLSSASHSCQVRHVVIRPAIVLT